MCHVKPWGSFGLVIFTALGNIVHAGEADACKSLKYDGGFIEKMISVTGNGRQCLVEDLVQRSAIDLINGKERGAPSRVISFKVDNLNIKAGGRGVIMTGAKNILRNSTIEVDSDTAVYLYGPGTVVEGNTFIIHQNPKYPYPAKLPAALKLRDADGAVIRNNRFIIKGGLFGMFKGQAEVAINLLESRDVTIEGNTIDGAKGLVRKESALNNPLSPDSKGGMHEIHC